MKKENYPEKYLSYFANIHVLPKTLGLFSKIFENAKSELRRRVV